MVNERNVISSFNSVKSDITILQQEILNLKEQQTRLLLRLEELISKKEKPSGSKKKINKRIRKNPKKR
ncbi:hypothetical protein K0A97_00850 [Patescibacteria group bacterium]|nr:hypothetical protein [Patescibacteria group bacterium]